MVNYLNDSVAYRRRVNQSLANMARDIYRVEQALKALRDNPETPARRLAQANTHSMVQLARTQDAHQ